MNKTVLFTVAGIVVLIASAITYVIASPGSDSVAMQTPISSKDTRPSPTPNADMKASIDANTQPNVAAQPNPAVQPNPVVQPSPAGQPAATNRPGVYTDYSEDAIAKTPGTKLLFFHATWCSQCRQIEASMKADGIPDNVTVFKIDYDSNQKLRQQYGVTLQTTFVKIDDRGNKVASYVAYQEPRFSSVERELLR